MSGEKQIVVTIDGPAASGKSTVARKLARKLEFVHINSGALYRALAVLAGERDIELSDDSRLSEFAESLKFSFELSIDGLTELFVDGQEIGARLKSQEVGELASRVAILPMVRKVLGDVQVKAASKQSAVVEGRDAGTVVFPAAAFKFYLDATLEVRASRRQKELGGARKTQGNGAQNKGELYEAMRQSLESRDRRDSTRELAPQMPASDAIIVDTSRLGVDEVVNSIYETITQ